MKRKKKGVKEGFVRNIISMIIFTLLTFFILFMGVVFGNIWVLGVGIFNIVVIILAGMSFKKVNLNNRNYLISFFLNLFLIILMVFYLIILNEFISNIIIIIFQYTYLLSLFSYFIGFFLNKKK
jgi:hypothetical protein